ncbi:hydroxyacid dehydrogenase [Bradyrhizobium sp. cf659]|uniref:hydroxyacid dehydrogenase n=1 Tax=Bradyrhizobium sp. cf659 TaxID=1761771 RepID=UPI0008E78955|nr:hydroxyacid dehydrogenase [Bradyrhizobium sp. cf659]SFJ19034.1 D-3-phosphoglycerate dehydrogenase [Bradyrhizobium sp. cf659]
MTEASQTCLIVQPIHRAGLDILARGGLALRHIEHVDAQALARAASDCVAVVTRSAGFPARAIEAAPALRVIGSHGVGVDAIDVALATERGIAVVNAPHANVRSVAEHAIALMFALTKSLVAADRATRAGDFRFKYSARLLELQGLTLGIVGFGGIGRQTAILAKALGLRVIAHSLETAPELYAETGVEPISELRDLLSQSDIVSLHLPLTPSTGGLIGAAELAAMRPGSFLVNTGRGGVVNERALLDALDKGHLAGAGLDVFASEDMPPDHPLLLHPRIVLTPHIAGSTEASLARTAEDVAHGILAVLAGERPRFLVNSSVWPHRRGASA